MRDVILSEAKNLACGRQMFRLRLNMTTPQIISDRAIGAEVRNGRDKNYEAIETRYLLSRCD
jgi:hypothetical protein